MPCPILKRTSNFDSIKYRTKYALGFSVGNLKNIEGKNTDSYELLFSIVFSWKENAISCLAFATQKHDVNQNYDHRKPIKKVSFHL